MSAECRARDYSYEMNVVVSLTLLHTPSLTYAMLTAVEPDDTASHEAQRAPRARDGGDQVAAGGSGSWSGCGTARSGLDSTSTWLESSGLLRLKLLSSLSLTICCRTNARQQEYCESDSD